MNKQKYWQFKNKSETSADLYLYVEIADWGCGYYTHSAQSFKQELDDLGDIDILNIYINSPGGDVFEGIAITNMLLRHKAHKKVYIDGLAASIASVIAMAGDEIHMPQNSMLMIHNAWTYTCGNSNDLRELADNLDKINDSIRKTYLKKAGSKLDEETLKSLLDKESWLTAQECFTYGLCDFIGEAINISNCIKKESSKMIKAYKNIPNNLLKIINPVENKKEDKEIEVLRNLTDSLLKNIKEAY